jgi:hypothetical protein
VRDASVPQERGHDGAQRTRSHPGCWGRVGLIGLVADIGETAGYYSMRTLVALDGILPTTQIETDRMRTSRFDRPMPIVAETEQIADRRNSCLESRAQISDGSGARCLSFHGKKLPCKISVLPWPKMIE